MLINRQHYGTDEVEYIYIYIVYEFRWKNNLLRDLKNKREREIFQRIFDKSGMFSRFKIPLEIYVLYGYRKHSGVKPKRPTSLFHSPSLAFFYFTKPSI